jgi:DNA-binding SARP family transcriptional activator
MLSEPGGGLSALLAASPESDDPLIGVFCTELVSQVANLTPSGYAVVIRAVSSHPERWLLPLRQAVAESGLLAQERAAQLLETVGEHQDIAVLRNYARRAKRAGQHWGEGLARRLAPRLWIDDLGVTALRIGDRGVEGRHIRRKALALLVYLIAQQGGAATPDQVIDALWPDLDPSAAQNSMHQTIYFLRRVFDGDYRAGVSAEYLHFDSDVVWLDRDLVGCRSWKCRGLLSQSSDVQAAIEQLVETYSGRFATDFTYEEWASAYRDSLHAQYLSVVERAVTGASGPLEARWRLWVGQRALQVDPTADGIEAAVIRLYKELGATSAAAEQYAHYAASQRDDLGVEPAALEDL